MRFGNVRISSDRALTPHAQVFALEVSNFGTLESEDASIRFLPALSRASPQGDAYLVTSTIADGQFPLLDLLRGSLGRDLGYLAVVLDDAQNIDDCIFLDFMQSGQVDEVVLDLWSSILVLAL